MLKGTALFIILTVVVHLYFTIDKAYSASPGECTIKMYSVGIRYKEYPGVNIMGVTSFSFDDITGRVLYTNGHRTTNNALVGYYFFVFRYEYGIWQQVWGDYRVAFQDVLLPEGFEETNNPSQTLSSYSLNDCDVRINCNFAGNPCL